jgi:hypothetical protein
VTKTKRRPRCILIAGPNGAGKTTFARRYLPENAGVVHFVNADLIASGLSPLKPEIAAIAAARMVLGEIDRLVADRADFAFETTLSGLTYITGLSIGSVPATASTSCILSLVPLEWRCGESPRECVKAATMFRRLTFFADS